MPTPSCHHCNGPILGLQAFPTQLAIPLSTSLFTRLVPQMLLPSWLFFKASCTQPFAHFHIPPRGVAARTHLSSKLYPPGAAEPRKIDVPSPATLQPPVSACKNPDSEAAMQRTWVSESKRGQRWARGEMESSGDGIGWLP